MPTDTQARAERDAAETYYDSDDADRFYSEIWGGEDIHVGLYEGADDAIGAASRRTVERMAELAGDVGDARVIDLGAGYGGSARWLVEKRGARSVLCLNISGTQNQLNRRKTAAAGLDDRIEVRHGSFDAIPADDGRFDLAWSQDAFLHGRDREKAFAEAIRVLKPGGRLIFTDIMQADDAPADRLHPVYERIHLPDLGSISFYDRLADRHGLAKGPRDIQSMQLANHYGRVREELVTRRGALRGKLSEAYMDRMIEGLAVWVESARKGWLDWGILSYDKPASS